MSEISQLSPQAVWQFFDLICSIPHISGHEAALAEKLRSLAADAGFYAKIDQAGNLIIERPASMGFENVPTVILQAHLDMVPASEQEFDFINTPISPRIDGEFVRATGTTLGADDGIGMAHALAIIFDREFRCGKLKVLLTTDEEVGMTGAANLDPADVDGKYLLNLDSGEHGFCIGCAGGARQDFTFTVQNADTIPEGVPVKISISGLPGGHSGMCIHENRGNSLKFLAEFLDQQPALAIASFEGGTVDNAIPNYSSAVAVSPIPASELQKLADAFAMIIKKDCPAANGMKFTVEPCDMPSAVWNSDFRNDLMAAFSLVPDGVIEFDENLNIVKTSSNFANVRTFPDKVTARFTHRSLEDQCRENITAAIAAHFALFHGAAHLGNVYPATTPKTDSALLKAAIKCAAANGMPDKAYAIHAGLESGWFSQKNPDLEIVSCGPDHFDVHTPQERILISAVEKFDRFLRQLILQIAK